MSSRRLLVILRHLPDDSPFKMAYNDDWPLSTRVAVGQWNETQAMRGDLWALIGQEAFSYRPILWPSAAREQEENRQQVRAAHDEILGQLRG